MVAWKGEKDRDEKKEEGFQADELLDSSKLDQVYQEGNILFLVHLK